MKKTLLILPFTVLFIFSGCLGNNDKFENIFSDNALKSRIVVKYDKEKTSALELFDRFEESADSRDYYYKGRIIESKQIFKPRSSLFMNVLVQVEDDAQIYRFPTPYPGDLNMEQIFKKGATVLFNPDKNSMVYRYIVLH